MSKAQGGIVLFFFILFMIAVIFFAIFILKNVQEVEDIVTNKGNETNINFGENLTGSTIAEKREKIKDPIIAPPELGG